MPKGRRRLKGSPYERVVPRLEVEGDCLVFIGARNSEGYGRIGTGDHTMLYAHRVVFEHHHGPIPKGMDVMHSCDNPPCCKIEHLSLGTRRDNARDAVRKGRHFTPWRR